eukprot:3113037-Amphidinium_carterae.1
MLERRIIGALVASFTLCFVESILSMSSQHMSGTLVLKPSYEVVNSGGCNKHLIVNHLRQNAHNR